MRSTIFAALIAAPALVSLGACDSGPSPSDYKTAIKREADVAKDHAKALMGEKTADAFGKMLGGVLDAEITSVDNIRSADKVTYEADVTVSVNGRKITQPVKLRKIEGEWRAVAN